MTMLINFLNKISIRTIPILKQEQLTDENKFRLRT